MRKWITYIFLFTAGIVEAQDIVVETNCPDLVRVGEQFAITWTINASGGELTAPSFNGLYKLMGPTTSYSSSTQIVNGKFSQQTSYSYTFYLQAMNEGRYVIAPAVIRVKNKDYRSDSIHIEVIKESAPVTPGQNVEDEDNVIRDDEMPSSDLFVRLNVNRSDVFIGEHVVATVKIYTRVDLGGLNEVKYPDFKGFYKEDLDTPPLTSLRRENVNGQNGFEL